MPLRLKEDYHHLRRNVPQRLRTLELWPQQLISATDVNLIADIVSLRKLVFTNVLETVDIDFQPFSRLVALEDFTLLSLSIPIGVQVRRVTRNISAFGSLCFLRRLEVRDSHLPEQVLIEAILAMRNLQELRLLNCSGITQLVLECMRGLHHLHQLCLANNGALRLEGLQEQPSVTWLDLSGNIVSLAALEAVVQMSTLRHLVLPGAHCRVFHINSEVRHVYGSVCTVDLEWFRNNRQDVIIELCPCGLEANRGYVKRVR